MAVGGSPGGGGGGGGGTGTVSASTWDGAAYVEDSDLRVFVGPNDPALATGGRDNANDLWVERPTTETPGTRTYLWNDTTGQYEPQTDSIVFLGPSNRDPATSTGGRSNTSDLWVPSGAVPALLDLGLDNAEIFASYFGAANALDQEFNRTANPTSPPTNWSWLNQGGATMVEKMGAAVLSIPDSATEVQRGLYRAVPAGTSWTAYCKLSWAQNNNNYTNLFMFLSDGTKMMNMRLESGNVVGTARYNTNNPTSGGAAVNGSTAQYIGGPGPGVYFRIIKNSATSYDFAWSPDLIVWKTVTAGFNPATTFSLTPTIIGFGAAPNASPGSVEIACHWFRFR